MGGRAGDASTALARSPVVTSPHTKWSSSIFHPARWVCVQDFRRRAGSRHELHVLSPFPRSIAGW